MKAGMNGQDARKFLVAEASEFSGGFDVRENRSVVYLFESLDQGDLFSGCGSDCGSPRVALPPDPTSRPPGGSGGLLLDAEAHVIPALAAAADHPAAAITA
jgi:hypothetical protein